MPKKKKGKKGKKGKKQKEYLPLVYNIPAYEDPESSIPKIQLKVQLFQPNVKELTLKLEVPINVRLEYIQKQVVASHKGAIKDIFFYKDKSDIPEILDMTKNLDDCGLEIAAEMTLYYDFKPYSHPVLVQVQENIMDLGLKHAWYCILDEYLLIIQSSLGKFCFARGD